MVYRLNEQQLRRYQDKQLRKVVKYAYTVPLYYKKYKEAGIHPKDIRGIQDIKKLPMVSKKDFRSAKPEDLLPPGSDISKFSVVSTSGSTGKPVTLYSDTYTIFYTFIGFIRSLREHNIVWRKDRMALIADLSPDSAEEAYFSRTAMPSLKMFINLDNIKVFHVGEKPEELIKHIEDFQPDFIGGYPGIVKILAALKKQGQAPKLCPKIIATSGAVVDEYTRTYIEKAFDATLFDAYGATECSPMAFQCRQGHYHLNSDFVYMEFMDPKEKEMQSGDAGNIVVTRLFGRGTPVIRYTGISDFVEFSDESVSCGIHTPVLQCIGGRVVDSLILPSGELIPPSTITGIPHKVMHIYKTDKIQQFQIIQQKKDLVEILIVVDEQLRDIGPNLQDMYAEMKLLFEKRLGPGITIVVKEVKSIVAKREGCVTPPPVVISKVKK